MNPLSQRLRRGRALLAAIFVLSSCLWGAEPEVEIRVIYDNTSARFDIGQDWGFSCVVTFRGRRILFDSGTDPYLFTLNLKKMGVDPASIEHAIISHEHRDHRGGIYDLYPRNPKMGVHFLDVFLAEAYDRAMQVGLKPHRVREPFEILPGAYSTGMIDGSPPEQSLAIETSKGIVLLVGCSHPGLSRIVERVRKQRAVNSIRLVLGGFHMLAFSEEQIREQIRQLQKLNVKNVMPGHCSGDLTGRLFREAYGENYGTLGAGKIVWLY